MRITMKEVGSCHFHRTIVTLTSLTNHGDILNNFCQLTCADAHKYLLINETRTDKVVAITINIISLQVSFTLIKNERIG